MTVRDTSILALKIYDESGKGEILNARILRRLVEIYPECRTRLELGRDLGQPINAITGKAHGLVKNGMIVEVKKRECSITGSLSYELQAIVDPQTEMF